MKFNLHNSNKKRARFIKISLVKVKYKVGDISKFEYKQLVKFFFHYFISQPNNFVE